ncbi:MAG TPA: alpha/beta hydrolase [Xanthobacteraceae bacterium]|jgi:pimeloyl-ACP methyl ester carboxylesterase|nr:alpha/beta hydrolase [Xanthobacteraceae bacterium]
MTNRHIVRRTLLIQTGLGVGAAFGAGLSANFGAGLGSGLAPTEARAATGDDVLSEAHRADKGGTRLALYRKRRGKPAGAADKSPPVLFLVHGSSLSAQSSFDLKVPGSEYSMMDVFARYGFDVWTMDHENYGRSSQTSSNSDIASGAEDLKAAMAVVQRETGRDKVHMFGESSGAIRAGAFAQMAPQRVDRLILTAFTYKGNGAAEVERRRERIAELRANPRRKRDAAMIRSIFTRDGHPNLYDPAMADALIASEMQFGDSVPSGTYVDMAVNLPLVDPAKVLSPVLMTRGEWDGNSTDDDLFEFFRRLPNGDRQYVILPNTAHSQGFSKNRQLLWYAMKNFLDAPAPVAS